MTTPAICVRCVMDTSDPNIEFNNQGTCNHCSEAIRIIAVVEKQRDPRILNHTIESIKEHERGRQYDCLVGLSGGVDSSYLAYKAVELGLRPLAIHLDNGWDTELAIKNIENIVRKLDLDLHTHVVDWPEFRDLQLSFIKADVIDVEMITDHAIVALAYNLAKQHRIRHILTGVNTSTESILPRAWVHPKTDLRNLKSIHQVHGTVPIRTLPTASTLRIRYLQKFMGIRSVNLLDLLPYAKKEAVSILENELGWTNYGGKHHESVFTRFYQQYILLEKFGVDKRRAHLSSLICSKQLTREEAIAELQHPPYAPATINEDKSYVTKKLGMTPEGFEEYMARPPQSHYRYASDQSYLRALSRIKQTFRGRRRSAG